MLLVHDASAPSQTRWEEFCRDCHRVLVEPATDPDTRAMFVVSDGGGPDVLQRAQLLKALERSPVRTAVVSPSQGVFRIHAALQLFNARARCFEVPQLGAAMDHIGMHPRQFGEIASILNAVCARVPRALTARQLAEALGARHRREQLKTDSGIRGRNPLQVRQRSLFDRIRRGA